MKNKFLVIITLSVFLVIGIKTGRTEISPAFQIGYGNIFDMAYTPEGSKLTVGTTYGVEFLDQNLNRVRLIDLPKATESLAFRPDGKQLAAVCNQQVYVWNQGYNNYVIVNTKKANAVSYSPNGELLVLRMDGRIEFWEATDELSVYESDEPSKTLKRHAFSVNCVAFASDGNRMVSGGNDQSVRLWEVGSSKELKVFYRQPGNINSLAFLNNDKILVASEQAVRVLDIKTGNVVKVLRSEPYINFYASVDESSRKIAIVNEHGKLDVWSSNMERLLDGQASVETNSVVFSPDGQSLITGSKFYTIEKWLLSSNQKTATRKGVFVESVAFHPDDNTLALGGFEAGQKHKNGLIILYDLANGQEIRRLESYAYPVNVLRFSPDGNQLVSWSISGMTVKLWNPLLWQEVDSLKTREHGKMPFEYDLNEDDQYVISAGEKQLTLWDAEFDVYHHPNWPQFYRGSVFRVLSRDGKFHAYADGKAITFAFGDEKSTTEAHKSIIKHLQLSPDAKYLASISWGDNTCMVWDLNAIASTVQ